MNIRPCSPLSLPKGRLRRTIFTLLMSGDTIFKANYGRTDLPTGNSADMKKSIERLFELPGDTVAYPGHGGEVSIAQNKEYFEYLVKI